MTWVLGVTLLGLAMAFAAPAPEFLPQDDIVLTLTHGFSAGQVVLQWTGGLPVFTPYRSATPTGIVAPGNALGSTGSAGWLDVPPPGVVFYYEVRGTGCASDAGCPTGYCADSYCCDAACSGTCLACDLAGAEGTCLAIARGEDPDGDCGPQARCDGSGGCLLIDGAVCTAAAQCLSAKCTIFFRDTDADGFGTPSGFAAACGVSPPAGYATNFTDCDDTVAAIHPGATEIAGDEIDEDCNGQETCYRDGDDDGVRTDLTVTSADLDCADPGEARTAEPSGDCNDANPAIAPGFAEITGDEIDQDCNGQELCYRDSDGDGFRSGLTVSSADLDCSDPGEARAATPSGDCCDTSANARPNQTNYFTTANACTSYDYNCDGVQTRADPGSYSVPVCGGTPPFCTLVGPGWVGAIPACGVSGLYRTCSATCGTQDLARTQACR